MLRRPPYHLHSHCVDDNSDSQSFSTKTNLHDHQMKQSIESHCTLNHLLIESIVHAPALNS